MACFKYDSILIQVTCDSKGIVYSKLVASFRLVRNKLTCAGIIFHHRQVSFGIKFNGLISSVVTSHVTLATINAHLGVNKGHYVLSERQNEMINLSWE